MRALAAVALALAFSSACSALLDEGCYVSTSPTPGGDVPFAFCAMEETGRTEVQADIYARRVGQLTYLFDIVLEEHGLVPAGRDWAITEFREIWAAPEESYSDEERQTLQGNAGFWHSPTEVVILNAAEGGVGIYPRSDATSHELMHAYDWRVLGVDSWHWAHRLEANGHHFALGQLGEQLHREVRRRAHLVAWTCGDGGEPPPPKYGCDQHEWWDHD